MMKVTKNLSVRYSWKLVFAHTLLRSMGRVVVTSIPGNQWQPGKPWKASFSLDPPGGGRL